MNEAEKKFREEHPILPTDEFIVMFNEKIPSYRAEKTLKDVFNRHGKGTIKASLPGSPTLLIQNIDWDVIDTLKKIPDIRAIGPNRKASLN